MEWRISRALADRLLAEADASHDAEVCGLLLGRDGEVSEARRCANVAADPSRYFELDPAALIAAHKAARSGGPEIVGCYHSHPNGVAEPSARDSEAEFAGLWLIVAGGALHAWHGDAAGNFARATLTLAS